MHRSQQPPPPFRILVPVSQQKPDRTAGFFGESRHPREFGILIIEITVHTECAGAHVAQRRADAYELVARCISRGDHLADGRLVRIRTRSGETESAGVQRFDRKTAHLGDIFGTRRLEANGALAHDVDAQWVMRDLGGDVDRARPALQCIEELGKCLPLPGQSVGEDDARNLFDAFHQLHQRAAMLRAHGGETNAAIAEHRGGDAVPTRRAEQRVPDCLAVVMRVHVHPAGRHQESRCIDLAPCRT